MKKVIIFLSIVILITGFGTLVYFGLKYSRGKPVVIEKLKRTILEVSYIENEINLTKGISLDIWNKLPNAEIKLLYQITVLPWPKTVVPNVSVKAFHNKKNIYFYLSWDDDTEDRTIDINKFSDACAIMVPFDEKAQPQTIMMGFLGKVNVWQWKASQDKEYWLKFHQPEKAYADFHYPFEDKEIFPISINIPKSAVNDLIAIRVGTITPKETQNVSGRGYWNKNKWVVIFKRSVKSLDPKIDASFQLGKKRLCAFAVWNGSKGDRGSRKSISNWVELMIK